MIRNITFRYDLLSHDDLKLGSVDVLQASTGLNSLAEIKRTARFTIKENYAKDIDFLNDRLRPVVILEGVEYPLGVFLLPSPQRMDTDKGIIREVEAYDVTQILKEDKFLDRFFAKAGTRYTALIQQIINSAGIHRVDIMDSPATITRDREFEIGTSKLTAANELLKELNYTSLYTDSRGQVVAKPYVLPNEKPVDHTYRNDEFSVMLDKAQSSEMDLFNVPNVFLGIASNPENEPLTSRYINDNPASVTSTVQRRRNIVRTLDVDDIADQETLDAYVKRIAYNASSIYEKFNFSTLIMPGHGYSDCLMLEHDRLGISGKYLETSWEMELKAGGRMTHSARKVVLL